MSGEIRDLMRILHAYGNVLASSSSAITYLLYTVSGIVGGWFAGLLWMLIGEQNPLAALVTMVIAFIALFTTSGFASSIVWSITGLHNTGAGEWTGLRRKINEATGITWLTSIVAAFLVSILVIPPEYSLVKTPVAVNLGVALGNLGMFVILKRLAGRFEPQQLFLFLYLILTIPSYFILAQTRGIDTVVAMYSLLTVHLGLSNFIAAVWYLLSARRRVAGILHAARGED